MCKILYINLAKQYFKICCFVKSDNGDDQLLSQIVMMMKVMMVVIKMTRKIEI